MIFVCVENPYEKCAETQVLLSLLIQLGFRISCSKLIGWTQSLDFLCVCIDNCTCKVSLSDIKIAKLYTKLQEFKNRTHATKYQLQSLVGSLNWACQALRRGRFFL